MARNPDGHMAAANAGSVIPFTPSGYVRQWGWSQTDQQYGRHSVQVESGSRLGILYGEHSPNAHLSPGLRAQGQAAAVTAGRMG